MSLPPLFFPESIPGFVPPERPPSIDELVTQAYATGVADMMRMIRQSMSLDTRSCASMAELAEASVPKPPAPPPIPKPPQPPQPQPGAKHEYECGHQTGGEIQSPTVTAAPDQNNRDTHEMAVGRPYLLRA